MPSRKRNKGKQRKASKSKNVGGEDGLSQLVSCLSLQDDDPACKHGCQTSKDHISFKFLQQFEADLKAYVILHAIQNRNK